MSGIAGIFYPATPKPVAPARIAAMVDAQAQRGPDGPAIWTGPGVGLGHCRLSIIDAGGSPQPMTSADGALTVTCDGEIYNFAEVRADLEAHGCVFATSGDAEMLLHGWAVWGAAMLDRLNGVFAFALHDARRQCLFLARDRFGVKPLHYVALSDGGIAFASELKGLLAHPLLRRSPDIRAVEDYLAFGYVPDDACLIAGVKKVPAAHALLIERGKAVPAPARWWNLDFMRRATGKGRALEEELGVRLREAVASRMVADVPLGAFLSGGLDGAMVVALMAEASKRAVKTCAVGFDADGERADASQIARRFATEHHERPLSFDDFTLIDTLVAAFDEPFGDASALTTYRLCELARESVTVALSGDGADESFAGARRYREHVAGERVRALMPASIRSTVFGALGRLYPFRGRATLLALADSGAEGYAAAASLTTPALRTLLFTAEARRELGGHRAEDRYVTSMRDAPARASLDRAQYADFQHWLPGNVLTRSDRVGTAVGLEVREPLLDHRLIEFAASLPVAMRLRRGQGQWLLRKAMGRYLPPDILQRRSPAVEPPVNAWFRGPLADEAARLANARMLTGSGWFDPRAIERIASDHRAGRAEHGRTLWQLVMLERSLTRLFG